jgi:hypothetical protein
MMTAYGDPYTALFIELLARHWIPIGTPMPLMGALMLKSLDKMIPPGCAYARYMDDWVILTRSRHQLRQLIKNMHTFFRAYEKLCVGYRLSLP